MLHHRLVLLVTFVAVCLSRSPAQTWTQDPNFHPTLNYDAPMTQGVRYVPATDGRVLISGNFSHLSNGAIATQKLAFLRADGTPDPTFAPAIGRDDSIYWAVPLSDGRVIASRLRGGSVMTMERYSAEGQLDPTFAASRLSGFETLIPLPDGRLLLSGNFLTGSTTTNHVFLQRFNSDGSVDTLFTPVLPTLFASLASIAVGADGKIIVGGQLTDNTPVLWRLHVDGTADATFAPSALTVLPRQVVVQPDGKVLVSTPTTLSRYNADGTTDATFSFTVPDIWQLGGFFLRADGSIVVQVYAGRTMVFPAPNVYVLSATGSVIRDCRTLVGTDRAVELACVTHDDSAWLVHGLPLEAPLTTVDPTLPVPGIIDAPPGTAALAAASGATPVVTVVAPTNPRLVDAVLARMARDNTSVSALAPDPILRLSGQVASITTDSSSRVVIQGMFTSVDGIARPGLARFNSNGTLDTGFSPAVGDTTITAVSVLAADGGMMVSQQRAGDRDVDGFYPLVTEIVRLASDGTQDATFHVDPNLGAQLKLHAIASDGRILASYFSPDSSKEKNLRLGWLDATGKLSSTLPTEFGDIQAMLATGAIQPVLDGVHSASVGGYANVLDQVRPLTDGRIIVSGQFGTVNRQATPGVARLNLDGSLDNSFTADGGGLLPGVRATLDRQDRVILSGQLVQNGIQYPVSYRLLDSGQRDPGYFTVPGLATTSLLRQDNGLPDLNFPTTLLQPDGTTASIRSVVTAGDGTAWVANPLARFTAADTPSITVAPADRSIVRGRDTTFLVGLGTRHPASYQWLFEGNPIQGATLPYLTLTSVQPEQAGHYAVRVTVDNQTLLSAAATLKVLEGTARLVNFSGRAGVTPSATPIIGFVITGDVAQHDWLLRAMGPSLVGFGVTDVLADPELTMFSGGTQIAHDLGGASSPVVADVARSVGAFPSSWKFPWINPADSALVRTLSPGAYTARATSAAGMSGTVLLEVYDTNAGRTTGSLRNASVRSVTAPGSRTATLGFVISGNTPMTILVRGIGPTLAAFGVNGALTDPELRLYAPSIAPAIATNAGWADDPTLAQAARRVGTFALPPGSRDAAFILKLEPGAYTAQLSSATGSSGDSMIEVYVLDQ